MDHIIIQTLKKVASKFPEAEIYIFGSRSSECKKVRNDSDLDIAVFNAKGFEFMKIEDELQETNIPYTMDILCMDMVCNKVLKKEILDNGIKI